MNLWSWISAIAEPTFLVATVAGSGLAWLILPGLPGFVLSVIVAISLLWFHHHLEVSANRQPVRVGAESMVGQTALVLEPLAPWGVVTCGGEVWSAVEIHGRRVAKGERVLVAGLQGLQLRVIAPE